MGEPEAPRTRLEQVLRERGMTVEQFRERFESVTGNGLSDRQAYRWIAGGLKTLPYPQAQHGLQRMFGEPAERLLAPPCGTAAMVPATTLRGRRTADRGSSRSDWERQVITMSAERARDFLSRAESSNVGPETMEQLADDARRLATAYPLQSLPHLLSDLVDLQERSFSLLEGRQKPEHTRQLYLLAGLASGLMAKASHDLGTPHDAMTQARTAYVCADNSGHAGLRAWVRGLQSLVAYWAGRPMDAVRYAQQGQEATECGRGTSAVWLASSEARAWAALRNVDKARTAIERANEARERVSYDEVDEFGGIVSFNPHRQLYYTADSYAWVADQEAQLAEKAATEALDAYGTAPLQDRAYGTEAGIRSDLAIARIARGEIEGAVTALVPALELPPALRTYGVVISIQRVYAALTHVRQDIRTVRELQENIETFSRRPLASLPR